jgi:hypothetical protein
MRPYIVNISSLPPSTLLNMVDGACDDKFLIAMPLLVHVVANNKLVPIFSEWLR